MTHKTIQVLLYTNQELTYKMLMSKMQTFKKIKENYNNNKNTKRTNSHNRNTLMEQHPWQTLT